MESFERRDFVIWREVCGDAVRAPLAVRDDAQSAKGQAHTITWRTDTAIAEAPQLPRLVVFSAPASSNPHTMRGIVTAVFS
jgi:hypothetical protein